MSRGRHKVAVLASALAICAMGLVVSACGSSGGSGGKSASKGGVTTINVGYIPLTSALAPFVAQQKGFFAKEHLKVVMHQAQSGAALVPAVMSGQYQFAYSNDMSLELAYGKGLPIKIVHAANTAGADPSPTTESLVVSKSSGIKSPADLAGKTIALDSLNNTPQIAVMTTLKKAGVNPKSVHFTELGYPDMAEALKRGRVAAADMSVPSLTVAKGEGLVPIANSYRDLQQNLPLSSWFTTQNYLASNGDVVKHFYAAIEKANSYLQAHPATVRKLAASELKTDPSLAKKEALPTYPSGKPSLTSLTKLAQAAVSFGVLSKAPANLSGMLAKTS